MRASFSGTGFIHTRVPETVYEFNSGQECLLIEVLQPGSLAVILIDVTVYKVDAVSEQITGHMRIIHPILRLH